MTPKHKSPSFTRIVGHQIEHSNKGKFYGNRLSNKTRWSDTRFAVYLTGKYSKATTTALKRGNKLNFLLLVRNAPIHTNIFLYNMQQSTVSKEESSSDLKKRPRLFFLSNNTKRWDLWEKL